MKRLFFFIGLSTAIFSADVLIFSYNRPLQLYAFLESFEQNVSNYERVAVIFRAQEKAYLSAYMDVLKRFSFVTAYHQGKNPAVDFKPLVLNFCFPSFKSSSYCVFAVDDIVIKEPIDLKKDASILKIYDAYGVFYRLGKNINYCYMQNLKTLPPQLYPIDDEKTFLFHLKKGLGDWCYPNNLDFTLYDKKVFKNLFFELNFKNPNDLEKQWSKTIHPNFKGICFSRSKIVNFPLNLVNLSTNKFSKSYSINELLDKFQKGLKMKIDDLADFEHHSPHVDYAPFFITRD